MNRKTIYNCLMRCITLCAMLLCLGTGHVQAQNVAVKSNGLMWLAMMPNAGCEVVVGERSTVDLSLFGAMNIWGNKAKILGFQPEYRYWFNGRPMTREYVGLGAIGATYDITWGNKVYQGDAGGLGLTFGYVMNFGKRLNVEFYGGCGLLYFQQKQYYKNDSFDDYTGSGAAQANANGYKILPTKLGVSVTYIIK